VERFWSGLPGTRPECQEADKYPLANVTLQPTQADFSSEAVARPAWSRHEGCTTAHHRLDTAHTRAQVLDWDRWVRPDQTELPARHSIGRYQESRHRRGLR